MNTPGSLDSLVVNTPGSLDSPSSQDSLEVNTSGGRNSMVVNTPGRQDFPDVKTQGIAFNVE